MRYQVIFHPGALREFDALPKAVRAQLTEIVDRLAEEPRPRGIAKLTGLEAYRLRVGLYRLLYAVKDERLVVLVVGVAHRRDVYRQLEVIRRRLRE